MIPVEYVVECRTEILDAYGRQALVKEFAVYGVLLRLNEKTLGASHCSATVRGSQQEIGKLKEAVNHLMKLSRNSVNNAQEESVLDFNPLLPDRIP